VEETQLVFRGGGAVSKSKAAMRSDSDPYVDEAEIQRHHEGSTDRVACIDDETFITGSDNGSLSLWNIHKKKAVFTYPLAHGLDPPLSLDEVSAELEPDEASLGKPQARWITALQAIPFSNLFVTGSWDGYVRVWKISTDKRRIEALGRVGCTETPVHKMLEKEGLGTDMILRDAFQALEDGMIKHGRVDGIINDLAIVDTGDRNVDTISVIAAVGKSHRLGRWKEYKEGKNYAILFAIPRKPTAGSTDGEFETADEGSDLARTNDTKEKGGNDFEGFD